MPCLIRNKDNSLAVVDQSTLPPCFLISIDKQNVWVDNENAYTEDKIGAPQIINDYRGLSYALGNFVQLRHKGVYLRNQPDRDNRNKCVPHRKASRLRTLLEWPRPVRNRSRTGNSCHQERIHLWHNPELNQLGFQG